MTRFGMTLNPSDIVIIPFPYSDLKANKRRPVLVLQAVDKYGDFLAVAITTKQHHSSSCTLSSVDFEAGSLPKLSYVRINKLYTLNTASVLFTCGKLRSKAFSRIQAGVCEYLGC